MKIGHGPATVIGRRAEWMARAAESQETCPGWSKLTLFARRSVAIEPRYSREAFLLLGGIDWGAGGDDGNFSARRSFCVMLGCATHAALVMANATVLPQSSAAKIERRASCHG